MIERYSRKVMRQIWTDENKFNAYLKVEILSCRAWSELGIIPKDDVDKIEKNAKFDAALTLTDYLLRGYELEGGDPEILDLVKEILIEGGAEGETLGELIISMRAKLKSLEGGKTLSKE